MMANKKPGPRPAGGVGRTVPTTIRSRPDWKAWVHRLADFEAGPRRADPNVSDLVDRALVLYAESIGFPDPAPGR